MAKLTIKVPLSPMTGSSLVPSNPAAGSVRASSSSSKTMPVMPLNSRSYHRSSSRRATSCSSHTHRVRSSSSGCKVTNHTLECQQCHERLDPKAFARPQRIKALAAAATGGEPAATCRTCVWKGLTTISVTSNKSGHHHHHRRLGFPNTTTPSTTPQSEDPSTTVCTGSSSASISNSSVSSLASGALWTPPVNTLSPVTNPMEDNGSQNFLDLDECSTETIEV